MASSVGKPIYFVLRAENNMVVTLDWWYDEGEDNDIDIDFKRVRETQVDNYVYSEKQQILVGKNDYLVIQISSRSSAPLHWDIGFNVR
jgi:hypothetical protein